MNPNQSQYQAYNSGPNYRQPQSPGKRRFFVIVTIAFLVIAGIAVAYTFLSDRKDNSTTTVTKQYSETAKSQEQAASAMVAAIGKYAKDYDGTYPSDSATLQLILTDYSPKVASHTFIYHGSYTATDLPASLDIMYYYKGYKCNDSKAVTASKNSVAIVYQTGDGTYGCTDN